MNEKGISFAIISVLIAVFIALLLFEHNLLAVLVFFGGCIGLFAWRYRRWREINEERERLQWQHTVMEIDQVREQIRRNRAASPRKAP
ncbi:hypothetical protein [Chitinimonas lacunae]|uniref:Uncharacterized protein n=1 Tax=Chitinimonas lacunae TaxID=1963018 RepID=A0ABV8MVF7_9NEIS